jgi:hypothetical protein
MVQCKDPGPLSQLHKGKLFPLMDDVKFWDAEVPHTISIYKEPVHKGKLCATLDTFTFSHLTVVEAPFHAHLVNVFLH